MHMNFHIISYSRLATSEDFQAQYSLFHDSFHYSIVFVCLINPMHTCLIIGTAGSELMSTEAIKWPALKLLTKL